MKNKATLSASVWFRFSLALLLFSPVALARHTKARQTSVNLLSVHEWGTFTTVAGPDGDAMEWLPLTGSTDLPSFVEHLKGVNFKGGLRGTTRMETPVLYFYSARETSVSVHVSFSKGLITEWYPRASVSSLDSDKIVSLFDSRVEGGITWKSVHIQPGIPANFPSDSSQNQYYAARQTSSAPLTVDTTTGPQHERFLFYRGVSALAPPLSATISLDNTVLLQNHFPEAIPNVILFERRGARIGYRIVGRLSDQASLTIPTALDGSLDALFGDLAGMLVSQGLFPDEAHAMLESWRNSWFEEGSRIIYLVPQSFVDSMLPLRISPASGPTVRVFVGRLELVTPTTQHAVETAFASGDRATLAKYYRFLEPILRTMVGSSSDPVRTERLQGYLESVYEELYARTVR